MVTLNLLDSGIILQIAALVLALVLSFLALRKSFVWLLAALAWLSVVSVWDVAWLQYTATGMAIVCGIFFTASLMGAKGKGRY